MSKRRVDVTNKDRLLSQLQTKHRVGYYYIMAIGKP